MSRKLFSKLILSAMARLPIILENSLIAKFSEVFVDSVTIWKTSLIHTGVVTFRFVVELEVSFLVTRDHIVAP